jgi:hypothetical protein
MATAVLGVGVPVTLIAVIATVSSKTVCVSLVPKYLIPVVPAPTGAAAEKYRGVEFAEPLQVAVATAVPTAASVSV